MRQTQAHLRQKAKHDIIECTTINTHKRLMMDIGTVAEIIGLLRSALSGFKQAKDLLPDSLQKADTAAKLEQAERQLKTAEAETAKALGYELCRKHFPPEIMLSEDDLVWERPRCGNKKDNIPYTGSISVTSYRRRF